MSVRVQWLGHASFRISDGGHVIYIDPWKLEGEAHDATVVLVSHSHYDHYSEPDILKLMKDGTVIYAPSDALPEGDHAIEMVPGQTVAVGSMRIMAVPAYNPNKNYHPQSAGWLGFVLELGGKRIYYAGDTDIIPEMESLEGVDLALLPVGGTYTMSGDEAAKVTGLLGCGSAVPYHWGDIVGEEEDAQLFVQQAKCPVKLLQPGESLTL
ncbi:MAG: MBL fold metallo-hydrolase [Sedimentisphaerales bacterium]|nr:MBL fold metallo-hydrolase [Sedimentisphaerales bacterium]